MGNDLLELLKEQLATHPAMQLQDCIKLLYQRILGSEHMAMPYECCYEMLCIEKEKIGTDTSLPAYDRIGDISCRFHLLPISGDSETLHTLSKLFFKSMEMLSANASGRMPVLEEALMLLLGWIQEGLLPFDAKEAEEFLAQYRAKGCPAIHHSDIYRATYHPAYRLLRTDYAHYFSLFAAIDRLLIQKKHVVIAIDGKCGAGKSTLANLLSEVYPCNLIHMDDFYLPADLRTEERLSEAGGNIHYERFATQVLPALKALRIRDSQNASEPFISVPYQVFDCHHMDYHIECPVITDKPLTIVEGSYSLRPEFRDAYDLKIFLDIPEKTQKERLLARNGEEAYKNFESKWIPMELRYFEAFQIKNHCDLTFSSDEK